MSKIEYMTVRDFKQRVGIPSEDKLLARAATQARISGWRGMKLKAHFGKGNEHSYPVPALKKIARALNIPFSETLDQDGREIQEQQMMTSREFRSIVPGLSRGFSKKIAEYCRRKGIVMFGDNHSHKYPYELLKKFAAKEGKHVPDAKEVQAKLDIQGELPLGSTKETDARGKSVFASLSRENQYIASLLMANTNLLQVIIKKIERITK